MLRAATGLIPGLSRVEFCFYRSRDDSSRRSEVETAPLGRFAGIWIADESRSRRYAQVRTLAIRFENLIEPLQENDQNEQLGYFSGSPLNR